MSLNRKFQYEYGYDYIVISLFPISGTKYDSSVVFGLKYTWLMNHIGNKEFICGYGNCGHTGCQRGLMNIGRDIP